MVNHIVCWNLKPELTQQERQTAAETIKEKLEGLMGKVDGIVHLEVRIDTLNSSTRDLALISGFTSPEALNGYQTHPEHLAAAGYVRSMTCDRICFDYEV